MKKLRKFLGGLKARFLTFQNPVVKGNLAGLSLHVVKGTLRSQPDQDDAWLFHLMGQFNNIFDIGANIGLSALYAKVQSKSKRLLLADPNTEALSIAAKNLILNGLSSRCEFIPAFVSDQSHHQVKFWTVGAGAAGSMYKGHAHTAAAIGQSSFVPTITLDELIEQAGWQPEFVKIDVEGAEAKVLAGARGLAALQRAWFMVEMHSPPELPMYDNAKLILDWANKTGYTAWYMKEGQEMINPEMIAHRGKCHLLLLPKEVDYPENLKRISQNTQLPISI